MYGAQEFLGVVGRNLRADGEWLFAQYEPCAHLPAYEFGSIKSNPIAKPNDTNLRSAQ